MAQKIKLDIKGMHCRSCELVLEKNIRKVEGVKRVHTNFRKGVAEIEYNGKQPDAARIEKAIHDSGYSLGKDDKKSLFSTDPLDYIELIIAASALAIMYGALKLAGVFDLSLSVGSAPGLTTVLLVGLVAGVSTCTALIGGLVLGISARHAELHPEASVLEKFRPHVFFNIGRLISYAVLGGFIGFAGSALRVSSSVLGFLVMGLGIVMFFLGLKLIDIFPRLSNGGIFLPKSITRIVGLDKETKEYSHKGALITGALTFFVPCGFTQAMQLYAVSTGSFTQGAVIMFLFALGTMPGILGVGGLTSLIKGTFGRYFFRFAGLVVIALSVFNISNGFNLASIRLPELRIPSSDSDVQTVPIQNGKQVATMEQYATGYRPNTFTVKKGIPVQWIINSTNPYTCASFLVVPKLGISKALQSGENSIEFTPSSAGTIRFTCSMGMYSGTFTVIN